MAKIQLLGSTPVLRAIIYAAVGIVGVAALITGAIDADSLQTWLERVPAIAATIGSVLALANMAPHQQSLPQATPTPVEQPRVDDYAAMIQAQFRG